MPDILGGLQYPKATLSETNIISRVNILTLLQADERDWEKGTVVTVNTRPAMTMAGAIVAMLRTTVTCCALLDVAAAVQGNTFFYPWCGSDGYGTS